MTLRRIICTYGDEQGHPGTILTFFPWPGALRERTGTGQVTVTAFAIPDGSLGFWADRLKTHEADEPPDRLGSHLALPSWLESSRDQLARALPALRGPQGQRFP